MILLISAGIIAYTGIDTEGSKDIDLSKQIPVRQGKQLSDKIDETDGKQIDISPSEATTGTIKKRNLLTKVSDSKNPEYSLAYSASELPMMIFTNEELEKLVPGSFEGDSVFRLYRERIGNKETFSRWDRYDAGRINIEGKYLQPVYIRFNAEFSSSPHFDHQRARQPQEYNRALYSNIAKISQAGHLLMSDGLSSLNSYYNDKYREYHIKSINKGTWLSQFRNDNKDDLIKEYEQFIDSIGAIFSKELVPVKINPLPDLYFILWFFPTEDFISKIPVRYRDDFRFVNKHYQKYKDGITSLDEYCKAIYGKMDFFQVCGVEDMNGLDITASYGKNGIEIDIDTDEADNLRISIINIHGQIVNETGYKYFSRGHHHIDIPIDGYFRGGVYFIGVESERGTRSYERISLVR
jgi:hypothetical protein